MKQCPFQTTTAGVPMIEISTPHTIFSVTLFRGAQAEGSIGFHRHGEKKSGGPGGTRTPKSSRYERAAVTI